MKAYPGSYTFKRTWFSVAKRILAHCASSFSHWWLLAACAPLVVGLTSSCCSRAPSGTIYLDHGEVFTRERLVNRRLEELKWLEDELTRPVTTTMQGARFRAEFTGFSGQLAAQFDPLGAGGAQAGLQMLQSTTQVAQLQNRLVSAALQQKLDDLQNGKLSYTNILGSGTTSTATATIPSTFGPSKLRQRGHIWVTSQYTADANTSTTATVSASSSLLPLRI